MMTMCCLGGLPFVTSFVFRSCSTPQMFGNVTVEELTERGRVLHADHST